MFDHVPPPAIPEALRWSFQPLPSNQRQDVRFIGPVHGLITHHAGVTKPCRAKLSAGVLGCELCDAKLVPRWRGYVPCVTFHGKRVVFLVGVDAGATLSQVAPGTAITFFRGEGRTSPVCWRAYDGMAAKMKSAAFLPGGTWGKGTDLWPWLCQLWADQELSELLAKSRAG